MNFVNPIITIFRLHLRDEIKFNSSHPVKGSSHGTIATAISSIASKELCVKVSFRNYTIKFSYFEFDISSNSTN